MSAPRWVGSAALAAALLLASAPPGQAQLPEAQTIRRLPNGGYVVLIGTDSMVAFPDSIVRTILKMRADLDTERAVNQRLQRLDSLRQADTGEADRLIAVQRELIQRQGEQIADLKREADLLERARSGGWLTVELGAGAGLDDGEPGVVAGLAIRRLRAWALLQKDNPGLFLGTSFPIF